MSNDAAEQAFARLGWAVDRRDWHAIKDVLAATIAVDYTELFGGEPASMSREDLDRLGHEASQIAQELLVHDRVDERIRTIRVLDTRPAISTHYDVSELAARLRLLAARTTDPQTARKLRELLELLEPQTAPGKISN